MSWSCLGRL